MELSYIGVQEKKEKQFRKKKIASVEDLIKFIPRKYYDFTKTHELTSGDMNCLVVECDSLRYVNSSVPRIEATCCYDVSSGTPVVIKVLWFNQGYLYRELRASAGKNVLLCGKVNYDSSYRQWSCVNPIVFQPALPQAFCVRPVYSKIPGMSEEYLSDKITEALHFVDWKDDIIPKKVREKYKTVDIRTAYNYLHKPKSMEDVTEGQKRLALEDMLYFALKNEINGRVYSKGSQYGLKSLKLYNQFMQRIPYTLTDDQTSVVNALLDKIRDGKRVSALIQGDVSCGKTIVSFLLAVALAGSGYQVAIMAPTQVLAEQHFSELSHLLDGLGVSCAYYGGESMRAKERKDMLNKIASGDISIVVGTHSLLSDKVIYKDLALTIVDEEHKFGVLQKKALVDKASAGVHSITMSATPIPRTLSQVLYSDTVDVFNIKQMPGCRKRVKSCISDNTVAIHNFLKKELNMGHQVYVVCPAIDPNEKRENIRSVSDAFKEYESCFSAYGVAALTGRNTKAETEQIISDFKATKTKILISTTVIEVGVNVPNATVMVVENAENFGLAGLHQLRGRVGRGDCQSYCILRSSENENPRLNAIISTNDGFKIAEEDLKMRGTGEFIGTRQSGVDNYISLILSSEYNQALYKNLKEKAPELIDSGICDSFIELKDNEISEASHD